ncbi:MAG: ECF RNA polymerase sigma factor SigW [Planctomycetes bacterium ADurb.Bin126]|nr:MAG: ECF RNA polymerase sigma factor SigW [Planctomycetes bacterium ADurb.Bin126]HOD81199.1 sigma-70 family RNA polymerase sigma factor [Phycisphaerae bacterium]HQL72460.1 sigma-70 family RNA polymerase sigma factor [Phycisphaerae bacterium]
MNDSTLQSESRISDEQLACQAQAGRSSCFAELVGRHERRLLTFLFRRIGSLGEAEDLLQDTFVRAWRNLDQYDPRWRVTTWLYTIASRLAASHYRKTRSRPQTEADLSSAASTQADPSDEVAASEQRDNLWALARRVLSGEQYDVLYLRYVEDFSVAQIADVVGKTQTHVKVLLFRGRNNLGSRLRSTGSAGSWYVPPARPGTHLRAGAKEGA